LVLYLKFGIGVVTTPYQYDYGEGFHWAISDTLSHGQNVYHGLNEEPYVTMVYTPLYYLTSALGIKIFGSSLAMGRGLSLLCSILSCVLIFGIVKKITTRTIPAITAGCLPLTVGFFEFWSVMFRVDALALCFSLAGLFAVVKGIGNKTIYWAVPLFLAAIFTKQSYVVAPVATIVYLFFKDRGRSFYFTGFMVIGGGILLGLCSAVFGRDFLIQTFLVGSQPHNWHIGGSLLKLVIYSIPAITALSLAYIVARIKNKEWDLFSIYFVLSVGMCILLITKEGAWLNYAIELVAAGSILVGLLLGKLLNRATPKCYQQVILIAILLILPLSPIGSWYNYHLPENVKESYRYILPDLQNAKDPVLCEDATLLMQSGKQVIWEPSVFVLGGYYKTTWNQTPFVNKISSQDFSMVVLNYDVETWWLPQDPLPYPKPYERLTEEMAQAIVDNYYLSYNTSSYWVYFPKWAEVGK
jgi:4-amino-4-deoxy-L-arabinose transferase-like glycosyltransferase